MYTKLLVDVICVGFGRSWKDWIWFLSSTIRGKSTFSKLLSLVFTKSVYFLRQERNDRIFQNAECPEQVVIDLIVDSGRKRVLSFNCVQQNDSPS